MRKRIFVFGEVLWDMLPSGKELGGAPSNFAYHVGALGADATVCTRIGNDPLGKEIEEAFETYKLSKKFLQVDERFPTGTVQVELDGKGQPTYNIAENVAWDNIDGAREVLSDVRRADAFYFGSLALRSDKNRETLDLILSVLPTKALRFFDLNLRAPFYTKRIIRDCLAQADALKLNDEELTTLARLFIDRIPSAIMPGDNIIQDEERSATGETELIPAAMNWLEILMDMYHLNHVVVTCGSRGSFIFDAQGHRSFCEAKKVEIVSTVGAGDAFTAVCVLGLMDHQPLDEINRKASEYAAKVCTFAGAMS